MWMEQEREVEEESRRRLHEELSKLPPTNPQMTEPLGKFGQAYLDSLKENRPAEYSALETKGELQSTAATMDERARDQFLSLMKELNAQHPAPKDANYAQRVQHQSALASQAREIVLHELLVPSPDEASDTSASDAYSSL